MVNLLDQVFFVNVWVLWCVFCCMENLFFVDFVEVGIVLIYGINYKDDVEEVLGFFEEFGDFFICIGVD